MRTVVDFRVETSLPEELLKLKELAYNLWWTWNPEGVELFRRLDDKLWVSSKHNPVLMLGQISQERIEELTRDSSFLEHLERVHLSFKLYMKSKNWYSENYTRADAPYIAYFSMEFGLTESLPIYSGGLGVLSGDHIKTASDLGLPFMGISLLFQQGYFEQYLNPDGWQQERYPINDFYNLPIQEVLDSEGQPLKISIQFPGREVFIKVWKCEIGRVELYLLDTNLDENSAEDQYITDQLYGGNVEMRIKQEIVLGLGGVRALHAMGLRPQVFHLNEGHAAFLVLERIRQLMADTGLNFREARVATYGGNVFTTHTPVAAGFDVFSRELMGKYFGDYVHGMGMEFGDLMEMGQRPLAKSDDTFNMAVMAMRNATFVNGVSKLHAKVSRKMAEEGFPGIPLDEIPISHVTNGVHIRSWISSNMSELFDRYLGTAWVKDPVALKCWEKIEHIPDTELWRTHERRRERLVAFVRERNRRQMVARGASPEELERAEQVLDPSALTIGFARRFATYKRATLIMKDIERLTRIMSNPDFPVQFIFAGKAHPRDEAGKAFIKEIVHLARDPRFSDRLVFLENYNMSVSRYLVQGADVWLNCPRRPMEASGTSGMKVAMNGGINLSVLDGWWDEGYTPEVGWAIGAGEEYKDQDYQDAVESNALYDLLEKQVIPLFYQRGRDRLPREWIRKMKASMSQLTPRFNTHRMVREYHENFYMPAKKHFEHLSADNFRRGQELTKWKIHILHNWKNVAIESVELNSGNHFKVGEVIEVRARVRLGAIRPKDVTVEIFAGLLDENRLIKDGASVRMSLSREMGDGNCLFTGHYNCLSAGNHGLGVRLIPYHEDLATKYEMALIFWA